MAADRLRRGKLIAGLMLPVLALIVVLLWWMRDAALKREAGYALFHGEAALVGRLAGHAEPLPAVATRCSNCHEGRSAAPGGAASNAGRADGSYAVALNREWLTTARPRRGGPPSAYDSAALCRVLRSGVDPVHVMIVAAMPRYDASDLQCQQLWTYLTSR